MNANGTTPVPGVPIHYAEDLPPLPPNVKAAALHANCHNVTLVRIAWHPEDRTLMMLCGECGKLNALIKVDTKLKIVPPGRI